MNDVFVIKRIVRKARKCYVKLKQKDEKQIRRKEARAIGKRLQLKKSNYLVHFDELKPSFYLPLYRNDYIQQRILIDRNYYENANLNYICNVWNDGIVSRDIAGSCVLDIGANIGNHTLYFFFECGIGKSYCFEPIPSTFNILKKNIDINGLSEKAILMNTAVGATKSMASMASYDVTNIGSTQIVLNEKGGIPVISIDSLDIKDSIKLIKVDVEGFEVGVLEGCLETIAKNKPYIMIEIQDENFAIVEAMLSRFSYKFMRINLFNYFFFV